MAEIKENKTKSEKKPHGLSFCDPERQKEISAMGGKANAEAWKLRKSIGNLVSEAFTMERRKLLAESLVANCVNGDMKLNDRLKILDLLLRLMGELQGNAPKKQEIEHLGNVTLKID